MRATWTAGERSIVQDPVDGDRRVQTVSFDPVVASTVTLRLDELTSPGEPGTDRTAFGEVLLADG